MSCRIKTICKTQVGIYFSVNQVKVKVTVAENRNDVARKPGFEALPCSCLLT